MNKLIPIALCVAMLAGCAGMTAEQNEFAELTLETMAMGIGYDMRKSFKMTPEVQLYFDYIEAGKIGIDGARMAEGYLRKITHPLIANRIVRLSEMVGFDLDAAGNLVGVDRVDMRYLQLAAAGFKMGLSLD